MTSQRSLTKPEARDRPAKDLTLGLIIGRALAQHHGGREKEGREGEKGMLKAGQCPQRGQGRRQRRPRHLGEGAICAGA